MAASTKTTLLGVNLFSFKDTIFNQKPAVTVTPQPTPNPKANSNPPAPRTRQRSSTVSRTADGGYGGSAQFTQAEHPKATRTFSLKSSSSVSFTPSDSTSDGKDAPIGSKTMDASIRSLTDKSRRVQRSHSTASSIGRPKMTVNNFIQPSSNIPDTSYEPQVTASAVVGDRRSLIDGLLGRSYATPETSRSTSPSSRDDRSKDDGVSTPASSISLSDKSSTKEDGDEKTAGKRAKGLHSTESRRGRRPLSMMFTRNAVSEPTVPSVSGAPPLVYSHSTLEPPTTSQLQTNTLRRPRDELAEGFKSLESEYSKFQSKSGIQKANILRTSLISFLRRHQDRASAGVTYDELDKRIRCLHRWWTGLLAQLKNRSAGAIAGADRTVYLEGVVGIMSRPEWRPPQSEFAPTCQEIIESRNASSASLASTASHYSVRKSVHHNIKTLFTRTLMETFAFATEKMGQPTTPGSMVAFSGKVMAYAFFFCAEVSEMMLALWNVSPQAVRRVVQAYQSDRATDFHGLSEYVLASFPHHLRKLGFTGQVKFLRQLKAPKQPPIGTNVDWNGPWIPRWCGKDTDLLFVFFRHYHLLLADYLLPSASNNARLCAPGFVQVMAQMLSIFDESLNRKPAKTPSSRELPGASTITFDDVLADASLLSASVQVPNRNAAKPMADNKLVILLRDIVYQKTPASEACNDEHISTLILALITSTKNLKMYDTDASIALCDLLEEVIPLLLHAEKKSPMRSKYVDWDFWLLVWKKMLESNNTMTELRTICLLYNLWEIIREDVDLKRSIVVEWLLSEDVWDKYFTHWCPMVRAYFLRFLCWRVARYDGAEADEADCLMFQLLSTRLRTSYGHHIYLRETAETNGTGLPSAQPCLPAPGRRLIILRNDEGTQVNSVMLSENTAPTVLPTLVTTNATRSRSSSSISGLSDDELAELNGSLSRSTRTSEAPKKRWSFMRSWGFGSGSSSPEKEPSPPRTPEAVTAPPVKASPPAMVSTGPPATFKFSLEWWNQPLLGIPNRIPTRLPTPSQAFLDAKYGQQPYYVAVPDSMEVLATAKHNWKYAGRALAEWNAIVWEHENFFERRKSEGRLTLLDVETPTLGMDGLKKL